MARFARLVFAIVLIAAGITLASSVRARALAAHMWPAERFGQCTGDPRIFCEPGSEGFARTIASLLPAALAQVEGRQSGPFLKPVRIYIYTQLDTYARYAGTRGGAGAMSFGEVHLAPVMQTVPAQHAALLAHELSHLHFQQRAGTFRLVRLPNWFMEGWATLTSDGGGAGRVTPEQASFALVHGRHFVPGETESLLAPTGAADFHLMGTMYYRQAALLVEYMQQRDPRAFADLVRRIETGQAFGPALRAAYGQPLSKLWQDFLADLRLRPAGQWKHG